MKMTAKDIKRFFKALEWLIFMGLLFAAGFFIQDVWRNYQLKARKCFPLNFCPFPLKNCTYCFAKYQI